LILRGATARRSALVLALAVLLVPLGVPRVLNRTPTPKTSRAGAGFAALCRDHGGTPTTTASPARRACVVRYGGRVYRMDAITPRGFDEDSARFQRQGCALARPRTPRASSGRGETFVYHPATGICERRPHPSRSERRER
jgi:hypothetical protein